jgi:protease I
VIQIVQSFHHQNKPIAVICHGAQLLAAADVLQGKRCSAYPACCIEVTRAGGEYAEIEVSDAIIDGNLVSAPAWPAHPRWFSLISDTSGCLRCFNGDHDSLFLTSGRSQKLVIPTRVKSMALQTK